MDRIMNGLWETVSNWLWGLLIPVMWYLKTRGDKEIDRLKDDLRDILKEKADRSELDRQRDNITSLFKETGEIRKDMNGGFQRITELIHNGQTQILHELAKKANRP